MDPIPDWGLWRTAGDRPTVATRTLYVRGLALVHLIALLSLWWQIHALIGSEGILPLSELLEAAHRQLGSGAWWRLPSLLWAYPTDLGLHGLCALGVVLSAALLAGFPIEGPVLILLWAVYLSLSSAGQIFLGYQWDALLLEATATAALVARWHPHQAEPPAWAWWLQRWLLFRLMFFAGWVKLASGDPSWSGLTALDVHFWTQPLPNPLSRLAHHGPGWLHAAGVVATLGIELVLPWLVLAGRRGRAIAASGFALLMGALALTGNYGFFQLLTVILCLSLLDDHHLGKLLPGRWIQGLGAAQRRGLHLGLPIAALMVGISLLQIVGPHRLPGWGQATLRTLAPLRSVNRYGLFARMTTDRPEIVLEGSDDGGQTWRELHLRHKPGPVDRLPPQVAPHMPRVDWQMWFAALGSCRDNLWLVQLMRRIVEGRGAIDGLFAPGTFETGYPDAVRAIHYRYAFSEPGTGVVWQRTRLGLYCPSPVFRPPTP